LDVLTGLGVTLAFDDAFSDRPGDPRSTPADHGVGSRC
jgi:hypothetical protein